MFIFNSFGKVKKERVQKLVSGKKKGASNFGFLDSLLWGIEEIVYWCAPFSLLLVFCVKLGVVQNDSRSNLKPILSVLIWRRRMIADDCR